MALKLYGAITLTCTRRVMTVCYETGVPFKLEQVDIMKGDQKTPEYLEKQPFGQTPLLVRLSLAYLSVLSSLTHFPLCSIVPRKTTASMCTNRARLHATLTVKFEGYERLLSKQKYVAGDELTLEDLFHLPHGALLAKTGCDWLENPERYPNIAR
jgi:glutathione S-transferase